MAHSSSISKFAQTKQLRSLASTCNSKSKKLVQNITLVSKNNRHSRQSFNCPQKDGSNIINFIQTDPQTINRDEVTIVKN